MEIKNQIDKVHLNMKIKTISTKIKYNDKTRRILLSKRKG